MRWSEASAHTRAHRWLVVGGPDGAFTVTGGLMSLPWALLALTETVQLAAWAGDGIVTLWRRGAWLAQQIPSQADFQRGFADGYERGYNSSFALGCGRRR